MSQTNPRTQTLLFAASWLILNMSFMYSTRANTNLFPSSRQDELAYIYCHVYLSLDAVILFIQGSLFHMSLCLFTQKIFKQFHKWTVCFCLYFVFLIWHPLTVYSWLTWNSVCRPRLLWNIILRCIACIHTVEHLFNDAKMCCILLCCICLTL